MPASPLTPNNQHDGVRLQKVLAQRGVASRRVCEDMITAGRIEVNGKVVTELGRRIDPEVDLVSVDGQAVQLDETKRYVMLNKPVGVVSSLADENGRPDLSAYTSEFEERVYNVGRLDQETSGLLILTNDGELANVLAHPSFGVTKTYIAQVSGTITQATITRLLRGIELDDGPIRADRARLMDESSKTSMIEITLHSGKHRIVRRMLAHVGHPVISLVRRSFGPLHLGTLPQGRYRELTAAERGRVLTLARKASAQPAEEIRIDNAERRLADREREDREAKRNGGYRAQRGGGDRNYVPTERGPKRTGRDERRSERGSREGGYERAPREGGYNRDDRAPREGGYSRDDRGGRPERGGYNREDRGGRPERSGHGDRAGRPERGDYRARGAGAGDRGGRSGGERRDDYRTAGPRNAGAGDRGGRSGGERRDDYRAAGPKSSGPKSAGPKQPNRGDRRDGGPRGGGERFGRDDRNRF
ncbi:pseudouridine synthase [Mycetocola tolaasinivorans]|uniref:Pseudouridine synthase n=1 Tax=Mycetocola tolaasinivorans TaxID=76635 RepID=A0A3L7A018_9MICO|nr:pseudouridine synthase [Mycetocola tolaasinivorans]